MLFSRPVLAAFLHPPTPSSAKNIPESLFLSMRVFYTHLQFAFAWMNSFCIAVASTNYLDFLQLSTLNMEKFISVVAVIRACAHLRTARQLRRTRPLPSSFDGPSRIKFCIDFFKILTRMQVSWCTLFVSPFFAALRSFRSRIYVTLRFSIWLLLRRHHRVFFLINFRNIGVH